MYKVKVCIKTNQNLLSSRISIDRMHFIWYGFFSSVHTSLLKAMYEINVTRLCLIVLICICTHDGAPGASLYCMG